MWEVLCGLIIVLFLFVIAFDLVHRYLQHTLVEYNKMIRSQWYLDPWDVEQLPWNRFKKKVRTTLFPHTKYYYDDEEE
jgi:hypothetical protein